MKNKGFTLIEIAVVLVIVAVLISGMLMGMTLVRSAELREVIGDYDRYTKAIKEFEDKYQALPGDMSNAETIWGSDASCDTTPTNTVFKIATCSGDGNGRIGASSTAGVLDTTYAYEWFRAWQQLANAGLIEGQFTGVKESATDGDAGIGLNVPKSKLSINSGWTLFYFLKTATDATLWGDNYGHVFAFGGDTTSVTNGTVLSAYNARNIDQKIDDGMAGTGIVRARRIAAEANCTSGTADALGQASAEYKFSMNIDGVCSLLFILGF